MARKKKYILIVDDEPEIRELLGSILKKQGYEILESEGIKRAEEILLSRPVDLVLLDLMLPDGDGLVLLKKIKEEFTGIPVIIITAYGNVRNAVEAMKLGATDFLEKPITFEKVISSIKNALKIKELEEENLRLKKLWKEAEGEPELIGKSKAIMEIRKLIEKVGPTDSTVFIYGENGVGKELVAKLIHLHSFRKDGPFVAINCAAIPDTLIESELFGYEKGAFTNAETTKKGKFEIADGGTIFLDEVADLSMPAQAKLLRVLQEKKFERVGGVSTIEVDVRIISATNKDLKKLIEEKKFREDLYYRLNVVPIYIPPLRERKEDIPPLVEYFLKILREKGKTVIEEVSEDVMDVFMKYNWSGNIRELKNIIERLSIFVKKTRLEIEDIKKYAKELLESSYTPCPSYNIADKNYILPLRDARKNFEKEYILKALEITGRNITETAKLLGIDRTHLHRKIKELGIEGEWI